MKIFAFLIVFTCFALPGFAQTANEQRYQSLSDAMEQTLSDSHTNLENFDEDLRNSGNNNSYATYRQKYLSLSRRLRETEERIDYLTRTNDKTSLIKRERDKYEGLINELEQLKSDYESWRRN